MRIPAAFHAGISKIIQNMMRCNIGKIVAGRARLLEKTSHKARELLSSSGSPLTFVT